MCFFSLSLSLTEQKGTALCESVDRIFVVEVSLWQHPGNAKAKASECKETHSQNINRFDWKFNRKSICVWCDNNKLIDSHWIASFNTNMCTCAGACVCECVFCEPFFYCHVVGCCVIEQYLYNEWKILKRHSLFLWVSLCLALSYVNFDFSYF